MKYKILDNQTGGRCFADGETFDSLEKIREQLASYHSIDWEGVDSNDNPIDINTLSLEDLLDYGEWSIEDENGKEVDGKGNLIINI